MLSDYDDLLLFVITVVLIAIMAKFIKPLSSERPDLSESDKVRSRRRTYSSASKNVKTRAQARDHHLLVISSEQGRSWPYYVRESGNYFNIEIRSSGLYAFSWQEFSPLKYYGYTVGISKGLSPFLECVSSEVRTAGE